MFMATPYGMKSYGNATSQQTYGAQQAQSPIPPAQSQPIAPIQPNPVVPTPTPQKTETQQIANPLQDLLNQLSASLGNNSGGGGDPRDRFKGTDIFGRLAKGRPTPTKY